MRIIVPFANRTALRGLHPDLMRRLKRSSYEVEFVDVSGSDHAYYDLLALMWAAGESFINIEHDNLPTLEQIRELTECPRPWCTFGYSGPGPGTMPNALGCVRFSAEIIAKAPNLWAEVGRVEPSHHWSLLHIPMAEMLPKIAGVDAHCHGEIGHAHQYAMMQGRNKTRHPLKLGTYLFPPGLWVKIPEVAQRHWALMTEIEWEWIEEGAA